MFLDFSTSKRQQKMLKDLDLALVRIETGEYGYCEITGEEIGLMQLEVQPLATRCVEAQKMFEQSCRFTHSHFQTADKGVENRRLPP